MTTTLSDTEQARLRAALADICAAAGIDPSGAVLVRYTMNAVYRLDTAGVVVRMAAGPAGAARAARVAQIAHAFTQRGLPTVRLTPGLRQPVHAGDWSATAWTLLPQPPGHRFPPAALAEPLRAIHATGPLPVQMPAWDPVATSRRRLARVDQLTGPALRYLEDWALDQVGRPLPTLVAWLRDRCEDLAAAQHTVDWAMPWSVIHGDAHAGNLLRHPTGSTVLCDLDSVAIGPPEWDLTPAAHGATRFGDNPHAYQAFAAAYGHDVTRSPAWPTLRRIRELQLLTSVIGELPGRPDVAMQLAHRLRTSLADEPAARWHRYQ